MHPSVYPIAFHIQGKSLYENVFSMVGKGQTRFKGLQKLIYRVIVNVPGLNLQFVSARFPEYTYCLCQSGRSFITSKICVQNKTPLYI